MSADPVELRIPANPQSIRVARMTVSAVVAQNDISVEVLEDLKLAVSEACTERLDSGAASNWLFVRVDQQGDDLCIEVWGDGAEETLAESEEGEERLWGMALIEALTDEVSVDTDAEGRRVIRMKKRTRG